MKRAQSPGNGMDRGSVESAREGAFSTPIVPRAADKSINRSPLRQALDAAIAESNGAKLSLQDLTVLSPQADPFRLDTSANHKIGKWLADTAATLGLASRPLLDSSWSLIDQCNALIDSKAYRNGGGS